jgi:hypothetical protein
MRRLVGLYLVLSLLGILFLIFINNSSITKITGVLVNSSDSILVVNNYSDTFRISCNSCRIDLPIGSNVSVEVRHFEPSLFLERLEVLH